MSETTNNKCTDCKYCINIDQGYSNYTVEGVTSDCLLKLNPELPKDSWYGEEPNLLFANKCKKFTKGQSVGIDVEREEGNLENYSNDEEIKALLREYYE